MISERLIPRSQRLIPRSHGSRARGWRERVTLPAVAGRRRLGEALGRSVVIQLMLAMSFVALAALLYMVQASQITVQQINIAVLRSDRQQLVAQNAQFRSQAVALQSLQRIDSLATGRLHMATPDITTAIWVKPVFRRVTPLASPSGDIVAAQRASSPLTWLEHALTTVHDSL
ncbi:MAG TPA: hypothetical protein VFB58_06965 [Chloroflexota bacterium]|nr:hypothetical protein [Chloroflexota bacterium]